MSPALESSAPNLDEDTMDDLLYYARTGDLAQLEADLSSLSTRFNVPTLAIVQAAIDHNTGNTLAHYACANGHLDVLKYLTLLTTASPAAATISETQVQVLDLPVHLTRPNNNLSTPLHYAALNNQLPAIQLLLDALPAGSTKSTFVSAKNSWGRDAVLEAENAGKEDVVTYLLGVMDEAELEPSREQGPDGESAEMNTDLDTGNGQDVEQMTHDVEDMNITGRPPTDA